MRGNNNQRRRWLALLTAALAPASLFAQACVEESEPNDRQAEATALHGLGCAEGVLTSARDEDRYRLPIDSVLGTKVVSIEVAGIPALAIKLCLLNAEGRLLQCRRSAAKGHPVGLHDLALSEGEFTVSVKGDGGSPQSRYVLDVLDTGDRAPGIEAEPNDSMQSASALGPQQTIRGRFAGEETDYLRFHSAGGTQLWRIQAQGEGLDSVAYYNPAGRQEVVRRASGDTRRLRLPDLFLLPGGHTVAVKGRDSAYTLRALPLGPARANHEREPNDDLSRASVIALGETRTGLLGDTVDRDFYRFFLAAEERVGVRVTPPAEGSVGLQLYWDGQRTESRRADAATGKPVHFEALLRPGDYHLELFANTPADAEYEVTLERLDPFARPEPQLDDDAPVDPAAPVPAKLAVEMSFASPLPVAAAYWHEAQRIEAELSITNVSPVAKHLGLTARTSHYGWRVSVGHSGVQLAPGETRNVPLIVDVAPDAWADSPVRLTVQARDDAGAERTAHTDLQAARDTRPVHAEPFWPLPAPMLGGLNVAWSALGGEPVAPDANFARKQAELQDGMAASEAGLLVSARDLASLPGFTVRLTGATPVPVTGFLLHPQAKGSASSQVQDFEISLSADGTRFEPVLSGRLDPLPIEQAFVLPAPVPARFARLKFVSNHGASDYALGEWKVVAAPNAQLPHFAEFNLAAPANGGHVVRMTPYAKGGTFVGNYDVLRGILSDTVEGLEGVFEPAETAVEWVVGFHHNRAAQISRLEWLDTPDSKTPRRLTRVAVGVSTESPVGPWKSLGTWTLDRTPAGVTPFVLEEPEWARYVRFSAEAAEGARVIEYPETLRIFERRAGGNYRSILGEWGHYSQAATYEAIELHSGEADAVDADPGDRRESAKPLKLGLPVRGQVQIGKMLDWYRVDVPTGQNTLTVTVGGLPTVTVRAVLENEASEPVPLRTLSGGPQQAMLAAAVDERESYWLRIDEPPRSIVFAWDTSSSVSGYSHVTYSALARFADDIQPGVEEINLLPFANGTPELLLERWSGNPDDVLLALNSYGRGDNSSDAEGNLVAAAEALAGRDGTRAILFITDAATPGRRANLWDALTAVRPRVYALHLSLSGTELALQQDRMQDWAAVNGGLYTAFSSQGELDRAFDRAAAHLRRPAPYLLTVDASFEAPPAPGTVEVLAPKDRSGLVPATGIEIILDASGSMLQRIEGTRRIDIAKRVLTALVTEALPAGTPLAIRVFGHLEAGECRTDLLAPLAPLNAVNTARSIAGIEAKNLAKTPIARSLELVADDLEAASGRRLVILVTDGEETCGGNPETAIQTLQEQGIDVQVNVVGFAVADEKLRDEFQRWAEVGGGQYFDAAGAEELDAAMRRATAVPFAVLDGSGATVAQGFVDGDPVSVPAGNYAVRVSTDPPRQFDAVVVDEDSPTRLTLDEKTHGKPQQSSQ